MALRIMTVKNTNPGAKTPYFFRSEWAGVVSDEDVVDIMAKSRTTLSKPDILACLQLYHEEISKLLADGYYVKSKLGAFYVGVSGTAQASDEPFKNSSINNNHDLHLHFRPNTVSRKGIFAGIKTVRVRAAIKKAPRLSSVHSVRTEVENQASRGDLVRIRGQKLKFDPKDERTGIFFKDPANREWRADFYVVVEAGTVIANVPQTLETGKYRMIVRTLPNGKDLSESKLNDELNISA